jgi:hypothetical protein
MSKTSGTCLLALLLNRAVYNFIIISIIFNAYHHTYSREVMGAPQLTRRNLMR